MDVRYEGALVDLDGTVYLGDRLVPGTDRGVETLRGSGVDVLFFSNKAIDRRDSYAEKLMKLGIDASRDRILNSGWVTAEYVADRHPESNVFVIGEQPLIDEFEQAGVDASRTSPGDLLVVSMDRDFAYDQLKLALATLEDGGPFLATNPDRTCPTETGEIPDAAGMIGAVEGVTGRELDAVLGKPSNKMVESGLSVLDVQPEECLVVGDRLETDILMGNRAGMTTVLVLSGVTDRDAVADSGVEPDYVIESLKEIGQVFEV